MLFARHGARLVVSDLRPQPLSETAEALRRQGAEVTAVPADVRDPGQVDALVDACATTLSGALVVHHNAAVYRVRPRLEDCTLGTWHDTLEVIATGTFLVSTKMFELMRSSGHGGRIINTGTVLPGPERTWDPQWGVCPDYLAAKGAVLGLTLHLADLGAPHGIGVSYLSPNSAVETPMQAGSSTLMREALVGAMLKSTDIARAALHLATTIDPPRILAVTPGSGPSPLWEVATSYRTFPLDDASPGPEQDADLSANTREEHHRAST